MLSIGLKELLEAGVHFGHQTKRWNPKMKPFIFDARNGIHIIDLSKSVKQLEAACDFMHTTVRKGGQVLFVGTKKQAQEAVREAAKACGQLYAVERWLGGTLTNFQTVKRSSASTTPSTKPAGSTSPSSPSSTPIATPTLSATPSPATTMRSARCGSS